MVLREDRSNETRKGVTITIQFSKDVMASLREHAGKDDRPVGYLIRAAVDLYLEKRRVADDWEKDTQAAGRMSSAEIIQAAAADADRRVLLPESKS